MSLPVINSRADLIAAVASYLVTPLATPLSASDLGYFLSKMLLYIPNYEIDSATSNLTKTYLNATYGSLLAGSIIYVPDALLMYIKIIDADTGDWVETALNVAS